MKYSILFIISKNKYKTVVIITIVVNFQFKQFTYKEDYKFPDREDIEIVIDTDII